LFEINTKQSNKVRAECQFLSFKPAGARNQQALKSLSVIHRYLLLKMKMKICAFFK